MYYLSFHTNIDKVLDVKKSSVYFCISISLTIIVNAQSICITESAEIKSELFLIDHYIKNYDVSSAHMYMYHGKVNEFL